MGTMQRGTQVQKQNQIASEKANSKFFVHLKPEIRTGGPTVVHCQSKFINVKSNIACLMKLGERSCHIDCVSIRSIAAMRLVFRFEQQLNSYSNESKLSYRSESRVNVNLLNLPLILLRRIQYGSVRSVARNPNMPIRLVRSPTIAGGSLFLIALSPVVSRLTGGWFRWVPPGGASYSFEPYRLRFSVRSKRNIDPRLIQNRAICRFTVGVRITNRLE